MTDHDDELDPSLDSAEPSDEGPRIRVTDAFGSHSSLGKIVEGPKINLAKVAGFESAAARVREQFNDLLNPKMPLIKPAPLPPAYDFAADLRDQEQALEDIARARRERQELEDAQTERQARTLEKIVEVLASEAEAREVAEQRQEAAQRAFERRESRRQAVTAAVALVLPVLAIPLAQVTGWWALPVMALTVLVGGLAMWLAWRPAKGEDR